MFDIEKDMELLQQQGRLRKLRPVASAPGPTVLVEGRERIMFASNDYLGFASHPRLKQAAAGAAQRWGAGAGAARLISGTMPLHEELEHALARFKQTEAALLYSTGYMANLGILASLAGPEDVILSDELNHASIIDGCRLSRARIMVYPHGDPEALEKLLSTTPGRRRIVVTDGVFSMDGDIAPVPELLALVRRFDAALMIDDAHGTGTLGTYGKGALEHFNIPTCPEILLMGTLGKALGCFGAFFAGTVQLREFFINRARTFIFTTAVPPPVVAAALEALCLLGEEPDRVRRLQQNAAYMRAGLQRIGLNIGTSATHIIPVMVGSSQTALAWAQYLFDRGLFITAIRPPAVPEGTARLRLTVLATHTQAHLDTALALFQESAQKFYGV